MKKLIIFFFLFTLLIYPDTIIFKDGRVLDNVKIINDNPEYILVKTSDKQELKFYKSDIDRMLINNFDPSKPSLWSTKNISQSGLITSGKIISTKSINFNEKKNDNILPVVMVTIISAVLSYDYLSDAGDLPDGTLKSRKTMVGAFLGVAAFLGIILMISNN